MKRNLLITILLSAILTACQSKPAVQYGGTYSYGDPEQGCGQVEIYPENDSTLLFHLYVNRGAPSYNNGEIEGRIVVRDDKAEFSQAECTLQFEFYGDSIRIATPGDCDCGFGYGVYADGTYRRTSSDTPQYYTTVAGDKIQFDQWQEPSERPIGSAYYDRIDDRFIAHFPDLVPGAPLVRGKLLPRQDVVEYLSDLSADYPRIYAVGKILGYKGLDLFVIELDYTREDEDSYDNHVENNICLLVYDKSGFALQIDNYMGESERAMHQLCSHYYGEGGESTLESRLTADTTFVCTLHASESESATGYTTPFVHSQRSKLVVTALGGMEATETTDRRYSSPFYDRKFLDAQPWGEVADEGRNQRYPTRNDTWQLVNEEADAFPTIVFFHIERIDGVLTPVFTTSESHDSQVLSRYAVGRTDNDAEIADTAPAADVPLIETSDGDLEILPGGKFRLHRR